MSFSKARSRFLQAKHASAHTMISNGLQTNGTLITDKWAQFFKQYSFLIGVSLDGPKEFMMREEWMPTGWAVLTA